MARKRIFLGGLLLFFVITDLPGVASEKAQVNQEVKQWMREIAVLRALRGLQGVYIEIEDLPPDVVKDGLTSEQIQTDVEIKLRMAGIKIIPTAMEWLKATGKPTLYINLNAIKLRPGFYAFCLAVVLQQSALLERDTSVKAMATTWSRGWIGMARVENFQYIRDNIKDVVDKFINDYLEANPKK